MLSVTAQDILEALRRLRRQRKWKPGKDERHLRTRRNAGHLPPDATLADYDAIIVEVISSPAAGVYRYDWSASSCYAVCVSLQSGARWLVMASLSGVIETAFVIDREGYLEGDKRYRFLGRLGDLDLNDQEEP